MLHFKDPNIPSKMYAAISDDSVDNQVNIFQYQRDRYIQKCSYVYLQEYVSTN